MINFLDKCPINTLRPKQQFRNTSLRRLRPRQVFLALLNYNKHDELISSTSGKSHACLPSWIFLAAVLRRFDSCPPRTLSENIRFEKEKMATPPGLVPSAEPPGMEPKRRVSHVTQKMRAHKRTRSSLNHSGCLTNQNAVCATFSFLVKILSRGLFYQ